MIVTSVGIPRDDIGTLNLKIANATESAIKPANAVQPYPTISNENQIRKIILKQFHGNDRRQAQNRRQENRRQQNGNVLLDTRGNRDRRTFGRRLSDSNHLEKMHSVMVMNRGFDSYA